MGEIMTICNVSCYEKDGVAWLDLEDVARGLGFTEKKGDVEYVMWRRVDGYLSQLGFGTSAERPCFIPENIFYRLAMKAKNETAEKFQALVADEIAPSIRKHGAYMTPRTLQEMLRNPGAMIQILQALQTEQERNRDLTDQVEVMRPKALFADAVAASDDTILIRELAKMLRQNGVDMGEKRLFAWLRDNGYLVKRKGTDYNMPTQRSMEMGLFQIKETVVNHASGYTSVNKTPKVTGKGQNYFVNKFMSK